MGTSGSDITGMLMPLGLLLLSAHVVGHLFALLRQPRVIGEIAGGLLVGPTVLGAVAPGAQAALFPDHGDAAAVLGWTYQLGLLLLMYCSGAEMRTVFSRNEGRVVSLVTVIGVAVPFTVGLVALRFLDVSPLTGEAGSRGAVIVVFSLAIAITSIPVISRILLDLGVIETSFARVVLGVAVLEDAVVYVILAATLGAVGTDTSGLPRLLGLAPTTTPGLTFHVAATLVVFASVLWLGPRTFSWLRRQRWNVMAQGNPIAYQLVFLFAGTLTCVFLGVTPIFGAFLAGIAVSADRTDALVQARESVKAFSFAYFIPVYFAIVGEQLDLVRHLDPVFLGWFLVLACVVKATSVFLGARLAGESPRGSWNLAVATNARGGPCIVLASVTFGAGVISAGFYTALVMLAIITSMIAGALLGRAVRSGEPLRDEPLRRPAPLSPATAGAGRTAAPGTSPSY